MITKFDIFKRIDESEESTKYIDIKNKYNSLGEYVEHIYDELDENSREHFSTILGKHLKIPKKKYNTNKFNEGDIVLIEYWYNNLLIPVKITEKKGRKYHISYNIEDNLLKNAPDEVILKADIIDHYRKTQDNLKEKNIDTKFRISVAVNLLNPYDQMLLVDNVLKEFKIDEKIDFEIKEINGLNKMGKNGFNSFLKVLSALKLPNTNKNIENCPNEFFIMYITEVINKERLINILNRFKSMVQVSDVVSETQDSIKIYYGLNMDNKLELEYGLILNDDNKIIIGSYILSKRLFDRLKTNPSKVIEDLKKQLHNIDKKTLIKLMKIKKDITEFSPGYFHKKSAPYIEDNIIHQSYHGVGNWERGTITTESLKEIENTFKTWTKTKKWYKEVQYKIIVEKFWVRFKIKLK